VFQNVLGDSKGRTKSHITFWFHFLYTVNDTVIVKIKPKSSVCEKPCGNIDLTWVSLRDAKFFTGLTVRGLVRALAQRRLGAVEPLVHVRLALLVSIIGASSRMWSQAASVRVSVRVIKLVVFEVEVPLHQVAGVHREVPVLHRHHAAHEHRGHRVAGQVAVGAAALLEMRKRQQERAKELYLETLNYSAATKGGSGCVGPQSLVRLTSTVNKVVSLATHAPTRTRCERER
jgi:hypothetical protein